MNSEQLCERCGRQADNLHWAHCADCREEARFERAVSDLWRYGRPEPWAVDLLEEVASLIDDVAHMRCPTSDLFGLPKIKAALAGRVPTRS